METVLTVKRFESSFSSLFFIPGTVGMLTGLDNLGVRLYWLKGQERIVDLLAETVV